MNNALYLLAIPALWALFVVYAGLQTHWQTLRLEVKIAGALIALVGLLLDIAINWTVGLILGVTRDLTLSQKCARLRRGDMGWRGDVAEYLCDVWLNPFDKDHC